MMKVSQVLAAGLFGLMLTAQSASALPIASVTYGGQQYDLYAATDVTGLISWADANAAATTAGGYLAVLTSLAEAQAVYNGLINNGFFIQTGNVDDLAYSKQAWVGATPTVPGTSDPTKWKWVTGEPWTAFDISNFHGGEPNGDNATGGLVLNRFNNFQWNDVNLAGGYIVESHVPDGGTTIGLLGLALTGLGLLRRRF